MDFTIRENRKPGGGRLVPERTAYFELMEQGYSMRDAARTVGINCARASGGVMAGTWETPAARLRELTAPLR